MLAAMEVYGTFSTCAMFAYKKKKKQEINSRYVDRKWEGERGRIAMHFLNPFRNFEISSNKNSRVYFRTEISKSQ